MEKTALLLLAVVLVAAAPSRAGAAYYGGGGSDAAAPSEAASSPAALAGAITAHVPAGEMAPVELLSSIQAGIEQPGASAEAVFSGAAVIGAMGSAENFAELQNYLTSGGSAAEVEAGKKAAAQLEPLFEKIQNDPLAKAKFLAAHKALLRRLAKENAVGERRLRALFDGSLADGDLAAASGSASGIPIGGGPVVVPPGSELQPSKPWPRKAEAEPPSPSKALVLAGANQVPAVAEPAGPLAVLTPRDEARVAGLAAQLLRLNPDDLRQRRQGRGEALRLGAEEQRQSAALSRLLERPLADAAAEAEKGHEIDQALADLDRQMQEMDPDRVETEPGFFRRRLARFRGKVTPDRYVTRYASRQEAINKIVGALEEGRKRVLEEIDAYEQEMDRSTRLKDELGRKIEMAKAISTQLETALSEPDSGLTAQQRRYIQAELLPAYLQREVDLRTQYGVEQSGETAMGIMLVRKRALLEGVQRTINVIPRALQIAAVISLGQESDQGLLATTRAVNRGGALALERNARALAEQGGDLQAQSGEAALPLESLKKAHRDLVAAARAVAEASKKSAPELKQLASDYEAHLRQGDQALERLQLAAPSADNRPMPMSASPERQKVPVGAQHFVPGLGDH